MDKPYDLIPSSELEAFLLQANHMLASSISCVPSSNCPAIFTEAPIGIVLFEIVYTTAKLAIQASILAPIKENGICSVHVGANGLLQEHGSLTAFLGHS